MVRNSRCWMCGSAANTVGSMNISSTRMPSAATITPSDEQRDHHEWEHLLHELGRSECAKREQARVIECYGNGDSEGQNC